MGRLTTLLLAASAGVLLLAGLQRLAPRVPPPAPPPVAGAGPGGAPAGGPFATVRSPAWSTTDAAVTRLQERLQREPAGASAPAYAQLAALYLQKARETGDPGYYGRAEGAIAEATRRNPDEPLAVVLTGSLQLARHDFAGALASGERALSLSPRNGAAYGVVGDAALELGRYERAVEAFQSMIDLRPDLASYSRVAYARELHGDLPGAIDAMRRAVNAGAPRSEATNWARVQLGHLYATSGDLDGAEREYRAALQALPNYVHAVAGLGRVAAARGDLSGAVAEYTRAQGLVPLPELAMALGDLHLAAGDTAGAAGQDDLVRTIVRLQEANGMDVDLEVALFEADRGTSPGALDGAVARARATYERRPSVTAADALAWALHRAGRPGEALPYAREALKLGSRDPQLLFHAGAIHLAAGEPERGRDLLRQALAPNPRFSVRYAPEAERLLQATGPAGPEGSR